MAKNPNINWGDKGDDFVKMLTRALRSDKATPKKIEQVKRVTKKATGQMKKQGKTARADQTRRVVEKSIKKTQKDRDILNKNMQAKRRVEQAQKETKAFNKADVEKKKSTGRYENTAGKMKNVSKERAEMAKRLSDAIGSQNKKRWKNRADEIASLQSNIKKEKDAALRRQMLKRLSDLRGNNGKK